MLVEVPVVQFLVYRVIIVCLDLVLCKTVDELEPDKPVPDAAHVYGKQRVIVFDKVPEANGVLRDAVVLHPAFRMALGPVVGRKRDMRLRVTDGDACPRAEGRNFLVEFVGLVEQFLALFLR